MGRIAYSEALLDIELNVALIRSILPQGSKLGFKYYKCTIINSLMEKNILSIDEAVNIILKKLADSDEGTGDRSISISFIIEHDYEELSAEVEFDRKNDNLTYIELVSLNSPWYQKTNLDYEIINWNLYISILLELCKDFTILNLRTIDENFNWY